MTTYFRVQDGIFDPALLLDADCQTSRAWGRDDLDRVGVSVCASREELATYLATLGSGIPYGSGGWVLIELTGDLSDDTPLDADHGEILIHPTQIISVNPIDDDFFDLIGTAYDAACQN
ncbi:hypothetical protein E1258_09470 [Micromonospora sp. KC207]|uniref:hypothetical protein n=1 Tax=Micromonospora sp. KC207 TaxID=2530377 RepID=UPI001050FCEC|nr:hypothetical protein [Micromonospora sp. KC207]TDC63866.1 hypothetical protein E1258_09470 [Micromonospora sp. KC207]